VSPSNPPAAYLWRPVNEILDSKLSFRVGGNFVYPPPSLNKQECEGIDRAVFIAGGVGINPVMSMISAMDGVGAGRLGGMARNVHVLYSSRRSWDEGTGKEGQILFEERLKKVAKRWEGHRDVDYRYTLFDTSESKGRREDEEDGNCRFRYGKRISQEDLFAALGPEDGRRNTVVYVCGLPTMTDEFVALLQKAPGMQERRVLCEKWW
jgi:NAD(P)H-flavin reductase